MTSTATISEAAVNNASRFVVSVDRISSQFSCDWPSAPTAEARATALAAARQYARNIGVDEVLDRTPEADAEKLSQLRSLLKLTPDERLLVTKLTIATSTQNHEEYERALNRLSDDDLLNRFVQTRSNEALGTVIGMRSHGLAKATLTEILQRPEIVQRVGALCDLFGYSISEFVTGTVQNMEGNRPGQNGAETLQLLTAYETLIQVEVNSRVMKRIWPQVTPSGEDFLELGGVSYSKAQVIAAVQANLQLQQAYALANDEYGGGSRNPDAQTIESAQALGYEALPGIARVELATWACRENNFVPAEDDAPHA